MKYLFSLHGNTLITKAELPPLPQYFRNNIQGNAQQGKRVKTEKSHFQSSPLAVTRSITGCFATQNIGEAKDGGVNKTSAATKSSTNPLPLPCLAALRDATKQQEEKVTSQPSSSVFCAAKYRGGVRRTEGLKNRDSNKIRYQTPPLPCPAALRGVVYKIEAEAKGEYISPSSSVFCAAKHRGGGTQ